MAETILAILCILAGVVCGGIALLVLWANAMGVHLICFPDNVAGSSQSLSTPLMPLARFQRTVCCWEIGRTS